MYWFPGLQGGNNGGRAAGVAGAEPCVWHTCHNSAKHTPPALGQLAASREPSTPRRWHATANQPVRSRSRGLHYVLALLHLGGVEGDDSHDAFVLDCRQQLALAQCCCHLGALRGKQVHHLDGHRLRGG